MARSIGPILGAGTITLMNATIVNHKPLGSQARVIGGTAVAAIGLALLEHLSEELAVGIAWLALVSVLFVRADQKVPSPAESITAWYNEK